MNKKITLLVFFLLGVITLSFVSLAFSSSNVQLTSPGAGSFGYLGKQGITFGPQFNQEMCNAGQDFVIQIPPFGCTPAVVRSDLLEEQNVPVLCQLAATKINPLIDVKAIDSLSFKGDYPEEVGGIGFHPARAAVRSTQINLLNSPILQNIGYAVILLKQQKNESAMPDVVSGNVTARIRYDIKNAFGIGKATQYLPEFTNEEWSANFKQYGFWDGRGFLRAEAIDKNHATISLYRDENNKISSTILQVGKISNQIYLPGFSCLAGLQLRLDGLKDPDTRVKLNINGEIVQVAKGVSFLDNKCSVRDLKKKGLNEEITIVCSTDEGGERFSLVFSPKIRMEIGGESKKVGLGDFLYESEGKSVYVGYIGTKGNSKNSESLFVYLSSRTTKIDKLSDSDLLSISRLVTRLRGLRSKESERTTSVSAVNAIVDLGKTFVGFANDIKECNVNGKCLYVIDSLNEENVLGKRVKLLGLGEPVDRKFTDVNFKTNFENAMRDYRRIIQSFSNEKQRPDDQQNFGQRALIDAMSLAHDSQQKRTLFNLCKEFSEKYPKDKSLVGKFCEDGTKHSSEGIAEHSVFVNGKVKSISLEGIYEPSFSEYSAEILVKNKQGNLGKVVLTKGVPVYLTEKEFLQLEKLNVDSAIIRINLVSEGVSALKKPFVSDTSTLKLNAPQGFGSGYVFTLEKVNLEKVAQVSVLPNIRNSGTETNFSFHIGIEKRGIQLSPEKTKERIETLNKSIEKWEDRSGKLGEAVRVFNAACLAVGTTLTIKNLIDDFDGKAVARKEVMRSNGGWFDICKKKVLDKEYSSVDSCLLSNSDQIDADVEFVENIIKGQEGITKENIGNKLPVIKNLLGDRVNNSDVSAALTKEGYGQGKVTLTQARDMERLALILNSNPNPTLKRLTENKLNLILESIKKNSQHFSGRNNLVNNLGISHDQVGFLEVGKKVKQIPYKGLTYANIKGKQIVPPNVFSVSNVLDNNPVGVLQTNLGGKYIIILDDSGGSGTLPIKRAGEGYPVGIESGAYLIYDESGNIVKRADLPKELQGGIYYKKFDRTSYQNKFKDPQVRFFETAPYKGFPALVPFDTTHGWYVASKQTLPGAGALRDSSIRAYDDSGKINSFYLCNVGSNGREEFNSGIGDDICRSFNPGFGGISGEFPGLSKSETSQKVTQAIKAVEQASKQYKSGLSGKIRILNENINVGRPEVGLPKVQCQDFMSPSDCHYLFNACDPVVCPSSRCDFGGSYPVANVVQSGIIGSTLLCLPNVREEIYVPICLTGVKAGIDSLVSVQENYRDCLQTNLETGETVGICDELHSIYLCDFFWSQTLPLSQVIVPKALEYVTGQTGRGGGEYLGVATAWKNAGDSANYITNYYGAKSFEAFKTGVVKEIGNSFCKSFISASYPDVNFVDSILRPESPPQYTAWFSERSFSTATVPAISQYKVFYHIFAGENEGAYYKVFLKSPTGTSFYQTNPTVNIANGFIPKGDFASETKDFTAVSGYKELCVNVNGKEECGFNRVTTDFGLDYLKDQYLKEQASQTNIKTENECISGTPSLYSLVNPNLQAGLENVANPSLYKEQIVRICSTDNPEKGTDPRAGTANGRWVKVGTCDDGRGNLNCYLDTKSVKDAVQFTSIENETLNTVKKDYLAKLRTEGEFINLGEQLKKIEKLKDATKVNYISQALLDRAFLSSEKATLILTRAGAYSKLALAAIKESLKKGTGSEVKITPGVVNPDDFYYEGDDSVEKTATDSSNLIGGDINVNFNVDGVNTRSIDEAIKELNRVEAEYNERNLLPSLIYYSAQYPKFSQFVDAILASGVLDERGYEEFKVGGITYNLPALKIYLENKKSLEEQEAIKNVEWTYDSAIGEIEKIEKEKNGGLPITYGNSQIEVFTQLVDVIYGKELLTPVQYNEITGGGYFDFNLAEDSSHVKNILRLNKKLE